MTRPSTTGAAERPRPRFGSLIASLCALTMLAAVCRRDDDKRVAEGDAFGALTALSRALTLDEGLATRDLEELTREPHVFGSPRQAQLTSYLAERLAGAGAAVRKETFTATVPNPAALNPVGPVSDTLERTGTNLHALDLVRADAPCVVALGSHYDTKDIAGLRYVGANDSGSSTAALVQIVAYLRAKVREQADSLGLVCDVVGMFFDGEEAVLRDWHDGERRHPAKIQDNTYGSRHVVSRMTGCSYDGVAARCLPADLGGKPLVALVLLDMIGSPGIQLSRDNNSSPSLIQLAEAGAAALGTPELYGGFAQAIEDDHVPFRRAGIAAIDLIDFNNIDFWHAPGDELAQISQESMTLASRLGLLLALRVAREPKVFLQPAD